MIARVRAGRLNVFRPTVSETTDRRLELKTKYGAAMTYRWMPSDLANYQARHGLKIEIVSVEPKVNKYRNRKTEVDGIVFDSKREATRYQELKLRERFGLISDLKRQVTYKLIVNGIHICSYRSDFEYIEEGQKIIEDSKGCRTREYVIKRNLMLACHGIKIRET